MSCLTPFTQKDTGEKFPCGRCPECNKRRVSGWSFRLMQEEKHSRSAHFITLTYDTAYIPISENGYLTLSKRDVQLFMKRLRKTHSSPIGEDSNIIFPLKYYLVGEYGGKTKRPHYHIILFNAELEKIQPAWDRGQIHYGTVSGASVGYTLKYINKQKKWIGYHDGDDRQPEFAHMSKGLGKNILALK